jgi:hypothetical protein
MGVYIFFIYLYYVLGYLLCKLVNLSYRLRGVQIFIETIFHIVVCFLVYLYSMTNPGNSLAFRILLKTILDEVES